MITTFLPANNPLVGDPCLFMDDPSVGDTLPFEPIFIKAYITILFDTILIFSLMGWEWMLFPKIIQLYWKGRFTYLKLTK